jgi:2-polyprenyl-3-methyl-5-hydroxy-6-metoxy-1,4-benzoquinol methylase
LLVTKIQRNLRRIIKFNVKRITYFLELGYWMDGERVNPDFPDENFQNHLKVYKFLAQFATDVDVLDVGCGTGYGTAHLAKVAKSIIGVDSSKSALRWARKHYPSIRYIEMDVQVLGFSDDSFDLIVSSENFEHLADQRAHVSELARVLRPNGLCFVASPNPEMSEAHNRFHTKENSYEELLALFSCKFGDVTIVENILEPRTLKGQEMRRRRRLEGRTGVNAPAGADTTWLHNTHSFFCFARDPRKQSVLRPVTAD